MIEGELEIVTASEIAAWAYCPESWRLQSLELGKFNEDPEVLSRGIEHHARTATYERFSRFAIGLGCLVAIAAGILMTFTIVRNW